MAEGEDQAGPVFKIGPVYVRTKVTAAGVHCGHPGDLAKVWPVPGSGPKAEDPDVAALLAWLRQGLPEAPPQIDVKRVPFAVMGIAIIDATAAIQGRASPATYVRLVDLLHTLKLTGEEAEVLVNNGTLVLSAESVPCELDQMLVAVTDVAAFLKATGLEIPTGALN